MAGEIDAGPFVRLACARHLRDIETGASRGLKWFWPGASHAIEFFRYIRHSKGEWAGQPLELLPWQVFVIGSAFGWMRFVGDKWIRRFRTVYGEVPKKNGKSTLLSGVGLYGLDGLGEPGAEIYAAATKKDQARIVFGEAREMVKASPELRSRIRVLQLNLHCEATRSKFEPLSNDANTGDGVNPFMAIVDELHRLKTRGLLSVLDQGMGARREPMLWIITTAGDDKPGTPYDEEHEYARKVLDGALDDDTYFAYIACPDEDAPWDSPVTWRQANPSYGVSVKEHDMRSAAAKARASASQMADFKRLRLNLRSADSSSAIKMETWRINHETGIRLDEAALAGRECVSAIDLSAKTDITCLLHLFAPAKTGDRWILLPRFWVPEQGVDDRAARDRAPYRRWIEQGFIKATLGNRTDYNAVLEQVLADKAAFRIREIAFDPWNAGTLEADCQEAGLAVVEFPQRTSHYAHPCKEFEGMLLDGEFEHFANPVLAWMASNLRWVRDHNGNPMPSKKNSTGRIDGIATAIMALGRAIAPPEGDEVVTSSNIFEVV